MAGKHDEVFLLGEEEVGADPWSAPEEEPTATTPVPGPSRSPRLRVSWPLILGALVVVVALAFLARPGGEGADPLLPRAEVPAVVTAPEVTPIARAPREVDRPHRSPERRPQRPRSVDRRKAMKESEEPMPAPLAETASAPVVTYAPTPEAAPEPAPEDTAAAPAQAAPLPAARPEFGIER
jgi:hypothetical protein